MTTETFYLEPPKDAQFPMPVMGHMLECHKCKRKILVEMALFGVPHHASLSVTCADCLVLNDKFKDQYPNQAKQIEEWLGK